MFWQCRYAASSRIDEILEEYKSALRQPEESDENRSKNEESFESDADPEKACGDQENLSTKENYSELEISTLTELLNEDDLLQEVRTKNSQLLNFLCKKSVFDYMVSQITIEPKNEVEMSERFKKPSIISEILSACTDQICERLVEENRLDSLWTLLSQSDEINPLQASFFSKVVTSLFPGYAKQFSEYLLKRSHIISSLVSHIGNSAFADVIMRIVTYQENESIRDEILDYMKKQNLVSLLIHSLGSASDSQAKMNSAMVLEDLIRLSRDHLIATIGQDQTELSELADEQCAFLRDIICRDSIDLLLNQMSTNSNDVTTVGFTIKLFVSMITAKPMALSLAGANEEFSSNTLSVLNQTISLAFNMLSPVFEHLHSVFSSPPNQNPLMLTSSETPQIPFGWVRLEIVEFVVAVLEQFAANIAFFVDTSLDALTKLINSNLISLIIDSFFVYTNNNILHGLVVKLIRSYLSISTAIKSLPVDTSDKLSNLDMPKSLLTSTDLLKQLNSSWESEIKRKQKNVPDDSSENQNTLPFSLAKGNFGHIVTLTEELNKFLQENSSLDQFLADDIGIHWKSTVTEEVTKILRDYEKPLGGTNPNKYSIDDDESANVMLSFNEEPALQKAFIEYSTQEMTTDTSHFESLTGPRDLDEFFSGKSLPVPQFSHPPVSSMTEADHERSTNLFESLCEQRLNTFKDLDEDDLEDMDLSSKPDFTQTSSPNQTTFGGASFEAKFNEVFGSPETQTNTGTPDFFTASSAQSTMDPFSSYDLFSSSTSKDWPEKTDPGTIIPQGVVTPNVDPFGVASNPTDDSSNWADFTSFGTSFSKGLDSINPNTETPMVLQSVEANEEMTTTTNVESAAPSETPFTSQSTSPGVDVEATASSSSDSVSPAMTGPPIFPAANLEQGENDTDEQLGDNFNFLSSSGLAKSFSGPVCPGDEPSSTVAGDD